MTSTDVLLVYVDKLDEHEVTILQFQKDKQVQITQLEASKIEKNAKFMINKESLMNLLQT